MNIEIRKEDKYSNMALGDLVLYINGEKVKVAEKKKVFEKLNGILEEWFK
jgi:hypothetical protein